MKLAVKKRLERHLEAWARWVAVGGVDQGGKTILARWMDGRGHIVYGSHAGDALDDLETCIEAVVLKLASEDALRADVLRLEYSAGDYGVAQRRQIRGYDSRGGTQQRRAAALGVSLRTYRSRLAEARQAVALALGLEV